MCTIAGSLSLASMSIIADRAAADEQASVDSAEPLVSPADAVATANVTEASSSDRADRSHYWRRKRWGRWFRGERPRIWVTRSTTTTEPTTSTTKPVVTIPTTTTGPKTSTTTRLTTSTTKPTVTTPTTARPKTSTTIRPRTTVPTTSKPTTSTPTTSTPTTSPSTTSRPTTSAPTTTTKRTTTTTGSGTAKTYRVTNGSGRSTTMDTSSPIGPVANHGTRIYCTISHFSHDDPIVYPGQEGAAHAHMFWGNTGANYASTGASLQTTGNSSCEGGINNRSSYWIPALYNSQNEIVLPESVFVYYKSFGGSGFDRSTLQPIPAGLEMLASRNVANSGDYHFRVGGSSDRVELAVYFPECVQVDGSGRPVLSSPDNTSHLSHTSGNGPTGCPSSHPYRIPQVIYIVRFAVPFSSGWSLSSDHHGSGAPGHSLHADYVAAWDTASMAAVTECVTLARTNCGFSGGRGQLPERFVGPDGATVYQSSTGLAPGADRTPFGSTVPKFVR